MIRVWTNIYLQPSTYYIYEYIFTIWKDIRINAKVTRINMYDIHTTTEINSLF